MKSRMLALCLGFALCPQVIWAHDLCVTEFTLMHYFQSRCVDVQSPETNGLQIHSAMIAKDLARSSVQTTLVLIPGGPGSSAEPLKTAMQKRELINGMMASLSLNVVLFDPRGTGMSPLPVPYANWTSAQISTELAVKDLRAVVDEHSPNVPVILMAHSAGGHVALRFAETYPERVKGLFLVSVSTSPRQMAIANMGLMAEAPRVWQNAVRQAPRLREVEGLYLRAEDLSRQQLKARTLGLPAIQNFRVLTPSVLRQQLTILIQEDPTGESAVRFIQKVDREITRLESEYGDIAPPALRKVKLRAQDLPPDWIGAKDMIQRIIMGNEGLLAAELLQNSNHDGVDLKELWGDRSLPSDLSIHEPVPKNIQVPARFLAGLRDGIVPNRPTQDFAGQMPNAKFIAIANADHEFFNAAPMAFFSELEKFLKTLEDKNDKPNR